MTGLPPRRPGQGLGRAGYYAGRRSTISVPYPFSVTVPRYGQRAFAGEFPLLEDLESRYNLISRAISVDEAGNGIITLGRRFSFRTHDALRTFKLELKLQNWT